MQKKAIILLMGTHCTLKTVTNTKVSHESSVRRDTEWGPYKRTYLMLCYRPTSKGRQADYIEDIYLFEVNTKYF